MLLRLGMGSGTLPGTPSLPDDEPPGSENIKRQSNKKKRVVKKSPRRVRNLEGRPQHSFWLQTSTDRFYPDFVCELVDGRFLVIEYKSFDRWSDDDSTEKRAIGQVWDEKSEGQCLFVMPKGPDWNAILAKLRG